MVLLRSGLWPKSDLSIAARLCVIGVVGIFLTGCAANKEPSYVRGAGQMAAAKPVKVELEDDGLPSQPPPVRTMKPGEDDPTQPWSPNYGRAEADVVPVPQRPANRDLSRLPKQQDAALRPSMQGAHDVAVMDRGVMASGRALSDDEAEAVMQAAIAIHEMRHN